MKTNERGRLWQPCAVRARHLCHEYYKIFITVFWFHLHSREHFEALGFLSSCSHAVNGKLDSHKDQVTIKTRTTELNTTVPQTICPPQPSFSTFNLLFSPPLCSSSSSSRWLLKACVGVFSANTMEPSPHVIFFLAGPRSHFPSRSFSFLTAKFWLFNFTALLLVLPFMLAPTAYVGVIG